MTDQTVKIGLLRDQSFLEHRPGEGHPESHHRLVSIYQALDDWVDLGVCQEVPPRPAIEEELLWVHTRQHLEKLKATARREHTALSADTLASGGSWAAALLAAGGLCRLLSKVVSGELGHAFALVRPPGHHAEKSQAMGFCLVNNVAVGAMFARRILGLTRVLIVDWDVHHGNGTQHCFEADPAILFFSCHQHPFFPGTGHFTETGLGQGEGFTINVPLSRGYGDGEYTAIFENILRPAALEFKPELILVSAGFDSHRYDPVGGMDMTSRGFAALTRSLMNLAEACCPGRLVLCLEGGYHLEALGRSVLAVLSELAGLTHSRLEDIMAAAIPQKVDYVLKRCRQVHRGHWKGLSG
jgi:acetoin utilization deacetylase AcuC-like enzyme